MRVVAIDCDLRKLYAVDNTGTVIAKAVPDVRCIPVVNYDVILFEIAGAVDYTDNKGAAHNKRRWTIFNIYQATILDALRPGVCRFAPSSAWTKGYKEPIRHKIAGLSGTLTHDLRECACMLDFWRRDPTCWRSLVDVIAAL